MQKHQGNSNFNFIFFCKKNFLQVNKAVTLTQ